MYKLLLVSRYLFRKWVAVFAVLSVWACVSMVLIVFSVMDGFLDNIKEHSKGLLSEIIIDNRSLQGFPYYDEFSKELKQQLPDEVERVSPVIYNYGIMRIRESSFTKPVRVVGIDLDSYCNVNTFHESLFYDKYYPGSTTLGDSQKPLSGVSAAGEPILPEKLESAFQAYRATHKQDDPTEVGERTLYAPDGVGHFDFNLESDEPVYEGKPLPGIIIGTDLIYERKADGRYLRLLPRGAELVVTLLPLTPRGTIVKDPIPVAVRYVDDSRTKVYEIDSMCVYVDFARLQNWLDMGALERTDGSFTKARASQLLVKLAPGLDVDEMRRKIADIWDGFLDRVAMEVDFNDAQMLGDVTVETWQERQQVFIQAVEKEKVLVTALFGVISLVAVVMISVVFYMAVLQKTRDIGIIRSLGSTRLGVASIFLLYGATIGAIGGILGVIGGGVFVHYINEVQDWLAQFNPDLRVWSPDVYTFDRIPNIVKPHVAGMIFACAVLFSTCGALLPAIKAALIWPVEALRYE